MDTGLLHLRLKILERLRRALFPSPKPAVPPPEPEGDPGRVAAVQTLLEELRPMLVADGGDLELLRVAADGWVEVRFVGACGSCGAQPLTLKAGLEPELRRRLAWCAGLRAT